MTQISSNIETFCCALQWSGLWESLGAFVHLPTPHHHLLLQPDFRNTYVVFSQQQQKTTPLFYVCYQILTISDNYFNIFQDTGVTCW